MAHANYAGFVVGVLFMATSFVKLIHLPDFEVSQFMAEEFHRYAEVFPLNYAGIYIAPDLYRTLVGFIELGCGSVMMYGRDPWRNLAALKLLILMMGFACTNAVINEYNHFTMYGMLGLLLLYFLFTNRS
ncbi:transmembrane protein 35B-like [Amphiura filiformis]|uniref:transmembrane protein 35B-like n=1 Tax=Amphiura filiformis TaxID=82378 RepID=UPI003B21707C